MLDDVHHFIHKDCFSLQNCKLDSDDMLVFME